MTLGFGRCKSPCTLSIFEAVFGDRIPVGAACDEEDIVARRGKPGTEITADRAGGHRCNTHMLVPVLEPEGLSGSADSAQALKKTGPARRRAKHAVLSDGYGRASAGRIKVIPQ